ncbi:hypothetical protein PISMIDRAFT_683399 [Pisolithus microcarpus 441]|uniref:Uncharacterized protein n=1 Tax=Pisolithus microcarpus 441 TaxID=765257 RepID=A0A0C9ZGU6_9AGAM|nr:hypothetical protein PISMIDRAFT_683399 [Pisolithus microcarpus 441]
MNSRSLAEKTLRQACGGCCKARTKIFGIRVSPNEKIKTSAKTLTRSNVIFMGENIKRSCPGCRKDNPFGGKAHGARSVYF